MNEDKIIQKLFEHDEKFERVATKDSVDRLRDEMIRGQEEMITILRRLDQERIFTAEWVRRIEKEVEEHREEIKRIKVQLNVA